MAQPPHAALVQLARRDALKYRENPNTFVRQIQQESGFDPNARSSAGAEGIAQIVPKYHPGVDPYNPVQALDYAARYMADLTRKYGGNEAAALSVYNSGSPTAYQDPSFAGGQTYRYVRSILGGLNAQPAATPGEPSAPAVPAVVKPAASTSGRQAALQALLRAVTAGGVPNFLPALAAAGARDTLPAGKPLPVQPARSTAQMARIATDALRTGNAVPFALAAVPRGLETRAGIQLDRRVLPEAEQIANRFGVKVNSGYRSPQHNAAVGGAQRSDHLTGDAVDFTGTPQQMAALQAWALRQKFPYVEPTSQTHGSHVHISLRR